MVWHTAVIGERLQETYTFPFEPVDTVPAERAQVVAPPPDATASLWRAIRPQQWGKNLFVLAPLLFSQNLFVAAAGGRALAACLCFCLLSSAVYLFNDIKDREQDRLHPLKRHRPLASGALSTATALRVMIGFLVLALSGGMWVSPAFGLTLLVYWGIQVLYTLWLKHRVILDVFAIASGFVLRVVGGGVAIQVTLSEWLLICTTLLALFLGFCKRRHELRLLGGGAVWHRQVLAEYDARFLDMMIGVVTASTVMSYALYTVSEETVRKFQTRGLLLTLPFVLYGVFRYLYLVYHKESGGEPTQDLFTDIPTMVNLGLWAAAAGSILLWK